MEAKEIVELKVVKEVMWLFSFREKGERVTLKEESFENMVPP